MPSITGVFEAERERYAQGEPIWITLVLDNTGDQDLFVFVPSGRADGLEIVVEQGPSAHVSDLLAEPEPGLVAEERLSAGSFLHRRYLLTQWLRFDAPGEYDVRCAIPIDVADASLRDADTQRTTSQLTITTTLHFSLH